MKDNMNMNIWKKSLAVGIILLFIGTAIIPSSGETKEKSSLPASGIDWWPMFHHDSNHSGYSTSSAPETNTTAWVSTVGDEIGDSSPAVVDWKVYICSDYKISCLDANVGIRLWDYQVDDYIDTSPAVANGKVYFGSQNHSVLS
jgi:outer membrane protein assembly factor BamB